MTNLTSDHLLARGNGDSEAEAEFNRLFLEHYQGIFRLAYRILGSGEEAQDLAQEVFLRLSQHRLADRADHNLRAWLCRVTANLAFNSLRDRKRQKQREDRLAQEGPLAPSAVLDPADAAIRRETCHAVRETLAQLPNRDAQLLLLRHAGLSYQELAELLDVAPGSVGTLIARAEALFTARWSAQPDHHPILTRGDPDEMRYRDTTTMP